MKQLPCIKQYVLG